MVIYSVIHKRVFTPRDFLTRIIEAIDHSTNSTMTYAFTKNPRIFCKCKCHCWVWRMVNSLYYSSRQISERCENSFVNYRMNYQKLCDLMRQITKEMNLPTVWSRGLAQTNIGHTDSIRSIIVYVTRVFYGYDTAIQKIPKRLVTWQFIYVKDHWTGRRSPGPDKASEMRCDTVATQNSKSMQMTKITYFLTQDP